MNKIRGAIVGLGKMGLSHTAIAGAHPLIDLVAVCDTSSLILDGFKKFTGINTYRDFEKMIDNEELDFIIVATPTKFHYPIVKYAFEKNVNVFCEKPLCLLLSEGDDLVITSKQRSLVNQVGYHNHFIGTFLELKRLLGKGVIGDLVHFSAEAYGPVVTKEKGSTWRSNSEEGGGCLYDYASHVVNLVQEILGRPEIVNGVLLKSIYSREVEDAVYALLTLSSGLSGTLSVNWSDETYRKMSTSLTVIGKKGKIICDATEIKIYLKEADRNEKLDKGWTIKYITEFALPVNFHLRGEEYSAQIDHFVNCIINKKQGSINDFEQGHYTDRIIEMIIDKAKQN
jgi:predicted dehydrogenase